MIKNILNKMTGTHLGILVIVLFFTAQACIASDNELTIDQTGDDLILDVLQSGSDNEITITPVTGKNFTLIIDQIGSDNTIKMYNYSAYIEGDDQKFAFYQNNDGTNQNVIELWHLDGDNNSIRWGQGGKLSSSTDTTFSYDGVESGGHYARFDIHGSDNNVTGYQANSGNGGHTYNQLIFSDNNNVWVEQRGNVAKTLNLTIRNPNNNVQIQQKEYGVHTATIDLTGSYGTSLDLIQTGTSAQTYNLYQACYTVGGCAVSIQQGN